MNKDRNLDLHALECFDVLLRERNVSRAAERLRISQSSASEALARLRERFGDPLLVRAREGMVPTAHALELVPQVRAAIDQLRSLMDRDEAFEPGQSSLRFRIATSDYAQLLLMPTLAGRFRNDAPGCGIDILPVHVQRIEPALEAGEIDLAIAVHPDPPPSLRRSPLFSDRYVCIARRGDPRTRETLTAEQFAALPHVSVAPSGLSYFSGVVDSALEAAGLTRRVVISSPHFLLAAHMVSQSEMVLAMPRQAALALEAIMPLQLAEIRLPMRSVEVAMYWHERSHFSRPMQWLRQQVRGTLAPGEPAPDPAAG
ncbi:MAG: LysR family transcriptional regulator [Lautropia sp.]